MKSLLAILLIFALLLQTTSYYSRVAIFYLNQDFVAENLCMDREEEDSDCEGACFLEKELETENSTHNESQNTETKEIKLSLCHVFDIYLPANNFKKELTLPYNMGNPHNISLADIFRPPLVTG